MIEEKLKKGDLIVKISTPFKGIWQVAAVEQFKTTWAYLCRPYFYTKEVDIPEQGSKEVQETLLYLKGYEEKDEETRDTWRFRLLLFVFGEWGN
jgi:hypothetical protein